MKQNIKLHNLIRLKKIKDYIYPSKVIMDVGCDHGYLIKMALDDKTINKAYAVDNKQGPLNQAKDNLKDFDCVTFLLQDGLSSFYDDVDCVIVAGMGGDLIIKIISDFFKNNDYRKIKFILEANKHSEKVRKFMINNGYYINNESIVYEDKKYYEVDSFIYNPDNSSYTDDELLFGPINLNEKRN